jgi:hypothetical protein
MPVNIISTEGAQEMQKYGSGLSPTAELSSAGQPGRLSPRDFGGAGLLRPGPGLALLLIVLLMLVRDGSGTF